MEIAIYDLQGRTVAAAQRTEANVGSPRHLTFDYNALPARQHLLVVMKDADDNPEVKKIFKPG